MDILPCMRLVDAFPNMEYGSGSERWILHEEERRGVPRRNENSALVLMDMHMAIPEEIRAEMGTNLFDVMSSPGLFMDEAYTETFTVGTAWMLKCGVPGTERFNPNIPDPVVQVRYMTTLSEDRASTLMTCRISEDQVIFAQIEEMTGRYNRVNHGFIEPRARTVQIVAQSYDEKYCDICTVLSSKCECQDQQNMMQFSNSARRRRAQFSSSPLERGSFLGNAYLKSWLEGSWTVSAAGLPPFKLEINMHEEGTLRFDGAMVYVYQTEIEKLHHPRSNIFQQWEVDPLTMFESGGSENGTSSANEFSSQSSVPDDLASQNSTLASSGETSSDNWEMKPFECKICGMHFRREYDVTRHMNGVHMKKKDHVCKLCPRKFSQRGHLNEHVRKEHFGIGFRCELCPPDSPKVFGSRSKLKRHMDNVHLNIRRYACTVCPKQYKDATNLRDHIAKAHP
mmetsp:Transcript_2424/g.10416  ORF Transcript_2424/g.10416 Transcript_2424/m.10416 type:complete len:453 (-) Transcript_2424:289-1647(-)